MKKFYVLIIILLITNCVIALSQEVATPGCSVSPPEKVIFGEVKIGDTLTTTIEVIFEAFAATIDRFENPDSAFSISQLEHYSSGYWGYEKYLLRYHPKTPKIHSGRIRFKEVICGATGITTINAGIISSIEDSPKDIISISPNPASDYIKISFRDANLVKSELYSISGEKILTINQDSFSDREFNFSVANIPSGIYYLKCTMNNKFVVQRVAIFR